MIILGDSIIKHVNGYEISKKLQKCKVLVRSFSESKIRSIGVHMKPSISEKHDDIILHVEANDLL